VSGITKPNADTEAVTSPSHLKTEKLTKKDLLVFYGGTKDIAGTKQIEGYAPSKGLHKGLSTQILSYSEPHTDMICFLPHV
jgi:hypothetical protein